MVVGGGGDAAVDAAAGVAVDVAGVAVGVVGVAVAVAVADAVADESELHLAVVYAERECDSNGPDSIDRMVVVDHGNVAAISVDELEFCCSDVPLAVGDAAPAVAVQCTIRFESIAPNVNRPTPAAAC